jgi:hypothetical protein
LFVDDMMRLINKSLTKNNKYMAKPAERLHFLFNFRIVFSHTTRRHRRVAPFNHPRGQMASDFHDFLGKHTDGHAHPPQVRQIAAPKLARQAFLHASTSKPRTPDISTHPT